VPIRFSPAGRGRQRGNYIGVTRPFTGEIAELFKGGSGMVDHHKEKP
jgi:hypothetical protein